MLKKAIAIEFDDQSFRDIKYKPQRQDIPEVEKTPQWFFKNAQYYLSFYNQPIGSLRFDAVSDRDSGSNMEETDRMYPVQHMLRMMMYYLGKQPNLDYAYLTQDVKDINMQSKWYKGQDVSEFVNYFRGLFIQRISQAKKDKMWSASPVGKEVANRYTQMYDKLEIMLAMKPIMEQMMGEGGTPVEFSPMPGAGGIESIEDIESVMQTSFTEQSAITATDLANGMWFTNGWFAKALNSFMHTTITGQTAWWHRVENGRQTQEVIQPYQIIRDNRFDSDYGVRDEFRGVVEPLTPLEAQRRWPWLTSAQIDDIYEMAADGEKNKLYNTAKNISWWPANVDRYEHTSTAITLFWRTRRQTNKVKVKNSFGDEHMRSRAHLKDEDMPNVKQDYSVNDIAFCTIYGNRYIVDWGYVDNLVESIEDPSIPEFPIKFFRPNTFLGESVSEVSRIHKIQDEMDMLDFKLREMLGRAKGKVYIIHGDKLGDDVNTKHLLDDFSDMGFHVTHGSGEVNDPNDRRSAVETVDMTLDPNIHRIAELYKERKDRMGRVLNTSTISLGQQTRYIGLGQQQSTISQNQLGVSYLLDGFMDFLVMNMRYSVNQGKLIYRDTGVEFLIGERGSRFLEFTGDTPFERFMTSLNMNDVIDEEGRKRIQTFSQAWSQNPTYGVSASSIIRLETSNSFTEAADMLDKDIKKNEKKQQAIAADQMNQKAQLEQMMQMFNAGLEQLKQDNENYRTELKEFMKIAPQLAQSMQSPPPSPIQMQLASQGAQMQQQQAQQQQQGQQPGGSEQQMEEHQPQQ